MITKVDKTQSYKVKIKSIIAYADNKFYSYNSRVKRVKRCVCVCMCECV